MTILHVRHHTRYEYHQPVEFGEHRLMCRPRDSHDLRLIDTALRIDPPAQALRWIHDVFGNSIAIATFAGAAAQLTFESSFRAEHYPAEAGEIEVEPYASFLPFSYTAIDAEDLGRTAERHYADPNRRIEEWTQALLRGVPQGRTLEVLGAMAASIKRQFKYAPREAMGIQSPLETLESASGSCRDFALFMMEAARSIGLAARFVSGYLYDTQLVDAGAGVVGGGATHAWMQVFLPGAGGWSTTRPTHSSAGAT